MMLDKIDSPLSSIPQRIGSEQSTSPRGRLGPTISSKLSWQLPLAPDDAKISTAEPLVGQFTGWEGRVQFVTASAGSQEPAPAPAELSDVCEQPQRLQTGDNLQKTAPMPWPQTQPSQPEAGHASMNCMLAGATNEPSRFIPQAEAFRLIAEGAKCTVTGPAFDHLLQLGEPAVVESVLQSLTVAARMQSHQKAQLVKMLSCQGLLLPSKQHFKVMTAYLSILATERVKCLMHFCKGHLNGTASMT